ncbi:MAG: glycosyltransferase [Cyanobacteria bacterium K_Offshore_surface_m2_239]|nr:glycosyltransferase [Cyanobacteria bacterium K_Offshore_surface_m2_239]
MRILQVIHQFPPYSSQGSEVYCQQLCHCLRDSGDQVGVFHISNTRPRRPRRLDVSHQDGIQIFHCVDGAEYSRLAEWKNLFLQESLSQAIQSFNPDVVHFHNYLGLGDDLVSIAKLHRPLIVYTLHDYGLICPNAILWRNRSELCSKDSPDFFADCCPTLIRTSSLAMPVTAGLPSLARWRQFAANQPGRRRRALLQTAVGMAEKIVGRPETTAVEQKKEFFFTATRRIFSEVDLFLSPSRFLLERYVACGIPRSKIMYLRNGMRPFPSRKIQRDPDARLKFGYIGAFHPHKGIELLLTAFRGLGDRATLHLHGSAFDSPISEAHFQQNTNHPIEGVVLHGRYNNSEIGSILAGLDVVIVPSLWYENSPLTIQEAQIAGVPVITAGVGGMAELVRDGIDGLHFQWNDAKDLRRVLLGLIEKPDQLNTLRANAPSVPGIEKQASLVREAYVNLLS